MKPFFFRIFEISEKTNKPRKMNSDIIAMVVFGLIGLGSMINIFRMLKHHTKQVMGENK